MRAEDGPSVSGPRSDFRRLLEGGDDSTLASAFQSLVEAVADALRKDLATIARSLNDHPRKTLEFMKPSEKLAELLAHTG